MITLEELKRCDPGIRDVVWRVNVAGFTTTYSGDGVSKPADHYESGCAMPFPHVVALLPHRVARTHRSTIEADAHRMAMACGDEWVVEVSYSTASRTWVMLGREMGPEEQQ